MSLLYYGYCYVDMICKAIDCWTSYPRVAFSTIHREEQSDCCLCYHLNLARLPGQFDKQPFQMHCGTIKHRACLIASRLGLYRRSNQQLDRFAVLSEPFRIALLCATIWFIVDLLVEANCVQARHEQCLDNEESTNDVQ